MTNTIWELAKQAGNSHTLYALISQADSICPDYHGFTCALSDADATKLLATADGSVRQAYADNTRLLVASLTSNADIAVQAHTAWMDSNPRNHELRTVLANPNLTLTDVARIDTGNHSWHTTAQREAYEDARRVLTERVETEGLTVEVIKAAAAASNRMLLDIAVISPALNQQTAIALTDRSYSFSYIISQALLDRPDLARVLARGLDGTETVGNLAAGIIALVDAFKEDSDSGLLDQLIASDGLALGADTVDDTVVWAFTHAGHPFTWVLASKLANREDLSPRGYRLLTETDIVGVQTWENLFSNAHVPADVCDGAPAKHFPGAVGRLLRQADAPPAAWQLAAQMIDNGTELTAKDLAATLLDATH